MLNYITYFTIIIIAILAVLYIRKQITLSQNIRIEDTTLEKLDEKLKKHKLIGGRHKRTNKKNPPIV
jgi:biopolymer transport protein ExbB/TolQ